MTSKPPVADVSPPPDEPPERPGRRGKIVVVQPGRRAGKVEIVAKPASRQPGASSK